MRPRPIPNQAVPFFQADFFSDSPSSNQMSHHDSQPSTSQHQEFYQPHNGSEMNQQLYGTHQPISHRQQPELSLDLPSTGLHPYYEQQSPTYFSPHQGSGSSGGAMTDYFQPQSGTSAPLISPTWMSTTPLQMSSRPQNGNKSTRQQFTACGACRHRRVKCDLKDRQEAADRAERGIDPEGSGKKRRKRVTCSNCQERGMNCIDEYAPMKAQKQLRRGKRITEIESRYGKAAQVSQREGSNSDESSVKREPIPELTKEFFDSPFFRRFHVQRPIIDPEDFVSRFFSTSTPCAANMGPGGSVMCHVLYAWAVSYGVDERGQLDVQEGGGAPLGSVNLLSAGDAEMQREGDRYRRREGMRPIVEAILREIDEYGLMRKPTWDGVRALLLVLPLTDGIADPVERLAMYESAVAQVFALCSHGSLGYDGKLSGASGVSGGSDSFNGQDLQIVRVRIYWYAFVHEGITTGLKGGRLILDEEDLETMQETLNLQAVVHSSRNFQAAARMATAPIRLAMACRLIHKALTGPKAKRKMSVNGDLLREAWEALESCWEEFESIKYAATASAYNHQDEIVRFADGWRIFLFEAQNVIRKSLEQRLAHLNQRQGAFVSDPNSPDNKHGDAINIQHLLDIARSKCEVQTRLVMEIVRRHVGTRFFEWDASLVRDGTYYAAMLLAKGGGSDEDIAICLQALNELRWAHGKSWERSQELRRVWLENRTVPVIHEPVGWEPGYTLVPATTTTHPRNPPMPLTVPTPVAITDGGLTSATSSYPSPSLVSPSFEHVGVRGYFSANSSRHNSFQMSQPELRPQEDHHHQHQQHQHQQQQQQKWPGGYEVGQEVYTGYTQDHVHATQAQVYGQHIGGQYVLQPDGTQVFVPYSLM